MKICIKSNYLRLVQLLLCLFVFGIIGCKSLKSSEVKHRKTSERILQLAVSENHFAVFNRQLQELGLVAVDIRPAVSNVSGEDYNEFWVSFKFTNEDALMRNYVNLMSNGFARRISYSYQ